jgi:alanyl-tRNA synthetase
VAEQKVDKNIRLKNASSHTAGHLISVVVEELYSNLKAVKGYHFLDGSYIEFIGEKIENKEEFLNNINAKIEELLNKGLNITVKNLSQKEVKEQFGIDNAKNFRVMYFDSFKAIPCGGTHLKSTIELKNIKATKVKSKKDRVKVSYSFLQR